MTHSELITAATVRWHQLNRSNSILNSQAWWQIWEICRHEPETLTDAEALMLEDFCVRTIPELQNTVYLGTEIYRTGINPERHKIRKRPKRKSQKA